MLVRHKARHNSSGKLEYTEWKPSRYTATAEEAKAEAAAAGFTWIATEYAEETYDSDAEDSELWTPTVWDERVFADELAILDY